MQQTYRRTPMPRCDCKKTLLKSHFGMGVLLLICCIFSEYLLIRTPMELVKNCCRKVFYTKYVLKNSSTARQTYNYNKRGFCYRCFCTQSTYIRTTLMSWCGVFANFEHILQIFAHIVVWYFLESIFPRTPMDLRATAS